MTTGRTLLERDRLPEIPAWYVVQTKPRQENLAEAYLTTLGLEAFLPKLRQERFVNGRVQFSLKPLFPAYLFACLELRRSYRAVKYGQGIRAIVSSGKTPLIVDEAILHNIRARMRDGYVEIHPRVQPGDRVGIESGALRGFEGIFEREMKGSERVVVLLETVKYQARVILARGELKPV